MAIPFPAPTAQSLVVRIDDSVPVIVLPGDKPYEELRVILREQLPEHLEVLRGRTARVDLGEWEIRLLDLRRLLGLLRTDFGIEITGLYLPGWSIQRFAERELKLKLFPLRETRATAGEDVPAPVPPRVEEPVPSPAQTTSPEPAPRAEPTEAPTSADEAAEALDLPGRRTLYVERTLRSGNSVRFDGDVTVFGDVNPGAQIVASGNIVVLGTLKGMAHAGATGDEETWVLSLDLQATQVRIARKIAIPPERTGATPSQAEIARIAQDRIVIETYRPRNAR